MRKPLSRISFGKNKERKNYKYDEKLFLFWQNIICIFRHIANK